MLSFIRNSFYSFKKAKSIIGEIQITFAAFFERAEAFDMCHADVRNQPAVGIGYAAEFRYLARMVRSQIGRAHV